MDDKLSRHAIVYQKLIENPWNERSEQEKLEFMQRHEYDTRELIDYIEGELEEQYLDSEITGTEYEEAMSEISGTGVLAMKEKKYEKLQEEYLDGEITEEELEAGLDNLFETGDDFLHTEEESDDSEESMFSNVVGFVGVAAAIVLSILVTKGLIIFPLFGVAIALSVYWISSYDRKT